MTTRVLVALLLAVLASHVAPAATPQPPACPPCGEWRLDSADDVEKTLDAALAEYKPQRRRRARPAYGDIAAESDAELQASLDRSPAEQRAELREELLKLARAPTVLRVRQDGNDVVIEPAGGPTRRVTPGDPHSRVDALGTAHIASRWRRDGLEVADTYDRRTGNRETYVVDAAHGRLTVTRSFERRGLPDLTLHSHYVTATP